MAVAYHEKVAAPAEHATDVKFEKTQVTTIAENDKSAERSTHGSNSGNSNCLVGRQDALPTAARAQGGEQAAKTADMTAVAHPPCPRSRVLPPGAMQ